MRNELWVKRLALGSILLLFGSMQIPFFNVEVVRATDTTPLIPMTTTWYGNKDPGTRTVLLTKQQVTEVEQLVKNIQEYFKDGITNKDAVLRFNHAITMLDTYELLPKGMTVEQGQHLFQGMYYLQKENAFKKQILPRILLSVYQTNYLCFIVGNVSSSLVLGPVGTIGLYLSGFAVLFNMKTVVNIGLMVMVTSLLIHGISPVGFMELVAFQSGNLTTLGLKGVEYFNLHNGYGRIHGFNGISLNGGLLKSQFLLGVALGISG